MRPTASPSYKLPQLRRKTASRLRYGNEVIVGADNTASVSSNNASFRLVMQACQPARNSLTLSSASELVVDATPARSGVTVILDPTAIVLDLRFFAEQKINDGRPHVTTACRSASQS
ncbi:hypothetical protein [Nonomuraea turcica]|uniref:hypothetical protein n=1 Tax=Nonomuraea sp. G32 TaxID=3067274 RepID=UPI00273A7D59|nr:hypothetical protein [Nonomuraea sp. G32]MDP4509290.1 hypothetical protein [Nonomuraea sp. G32]